MVVLELAASRAWWGSPLPPERARGIALHESFGYVVSQVSEVSAPGGWLRVHRVVCAIDCGSVANALFALNGTRVRSLPLQQ